LLAVDLSERATSDFTPTALPSRFVPTRRRIAGLRDPSTLIASMPADFLFSVVDAHQNLAHWDDGEIKLQVVCGEADVPSVITFASKRTLDESRFVPPGVGILRIKATDAAGRFYANVNPMKVFRKEPRLKTFGRIYTPIRTTALTASVATVLSTPRYTSGLDFTL